MLNANWLKERLRGTYDLPYDRPVMHECVVSATSLNHDTGSSALDVAKRLIELGFHPPTVYFPLIVDEALMIEPTETESPQTRRRARRRVHPGRRGGAGRRERRRRQGRPADDAGGTGRRGAGRPQARRDLRPAHRE